MLLLYADQCLKCRDGMGIEVFCHEGKTQIQQIFPEMFGVYEQQDDEKNGRKHFIHKNPERIEKPTDKPGLGHNWAIWWSTDSWYLGYADRDLGGDGGIAKCQVDVTCPHRINTEYSHTNEWVVFAKGLDYPGVDEVCLRVALTPEIGR